MTKKDIQRVSSDQLVQGHEGIPPLVGHVGGWTPTWHGNEFW